MKSASIVGMFLLASCAADSSNRFFVITGNQPSDTCVADPSSGVVMTRGRIDTTVPSPNGGAAPNEFGYDLAAIAKSAIVAPNEEQIFVRTIFVQSADVSLEFVGAPLFNDAEVAALDAAGLMNFRQYVSASIAPGGEQGLHIEIVPPGILDAVREKQVAGAEDVVVVATVELTGEIGGGSVSSVPFKYPVTICTGCQWESVGMCSALVEDSPHVGGACGLVQDGFLACCTSGGGAQVCPAVKPETTM